MKHILVYGMTSNPGGIEAYLLEFFRRINGKNVALDFVSDFEIVAYSDVFTENGAKIYHIPAKSKDVWQHLRQLRKILKEHKEYRTIYFNVLDAGAAVTMLVPFLMGRKIVVHSHNGDTDKKKLHMLCKPVLNVMASARVSCSDVASVHMFGKHDKVLKIPNLINAEKYRFDPVVRNQKRKELNIENKFVLCHVGRLSRQKNPMFLVDIFEAVKKLRDDSVLLSVGSGELEREFHNYIEMKGLKDSVICLGVRNDVSEVLQAADVFLLPSLYEGLSIAGLEAQAAGLPCVMSDAVSKETDVTGLVRFVSLDESLKMWADITVSAAEVQRTDTGELFKNKGFDITCSEEHDKKLLKSFR